MPPLDPLRVPEAPDDAPCVGTAGKLEPEHRLADIPFHPDAVEAALAAAGVLKRP